MILLEFAAEVRNYVPSPVEFAVENARRYFRVRMTGGKSLPAAVLQR